MAKSENSLAAEHAEKTETFLKELACRRLDDAAVILFGSRADGTHGRRSDSDIAYPPGGDFDPVSIIRLREDIEKSNVIYGVDLVDLSEVEESFREKVLREGVVWKN